jgi:mannose-6-phosphate isomerase-like protein (cupin superfamily)
MGTSAPGRLPGIEPVAHPGWLRIHCAWMHEQSNEVFPGVFVSNVNTDAWERDPEVGGEMHILCSGVGVEAGLSRFPDVSEPVSWTLPERETVVVLDGEAKLEIGDGPTLELKAGDIISLPKGALTTWHVTSAFREFWVINR